MVLSFCIQGPAQGCQLQRLRHACIIFCFTMHMGHCPSAHAASVMCNDGWPGAVVAVCQFLLSTTAGAESRARRAAMKATHCHLAASFAGC